MDNYKEDEILTNETEPIIDPNNEEVELEKEDEPVEEEEDTGAVEDNSNKQDSVILSYILNEKRNWVLVDDELPPVDTPVIIRFMNPDIVYKKTDEGSFCAEDIKLATVDANHQWKIIPPYPKYDYSPLSKNDKFIEGTVITHWALPEEGEVEAWKERFSFIHTYKEFSLKVDPEHEENIYRAIMHASEALVRVAGKEFYNCKPGQGVRMLYEYLSDLLSAIDQSNNTKE